MTGRHPAATFAALLVAVASAMVVHLAVGASWLSPREVAAALFGRGSAPASHVQIVDQLRVPRALIATVAGAMLAIAGTLLQAATRNPLASPELTGATSGAVLAVVAWSQFGPPSLRAGLGPALGLVAFAGSVAASGAAVALAGRRRGPLVLLLTGVLLSGVLSSATSLLLLRRASTLGGTLMWIVGSLNGRTWAHWHLLWPAAVTTAIATTAVVPAANLMTLGDATAHSAGLRPGGARVRLVAVAVLATAGAVMVVGAVGFVGLIAPHLGRRLVGSDHRALVPVAAAIGALVVIAADCAAQLISAIPAFGNADARTGVPLGATTALVGVPLFLGLSRRAAGPR